LLPWLSALENVMFGLEMKGMRGTALRDTAMQYVKLVGLGDSWNRRPYQLSGGMQQRVGIARALATDPQILLMDEPFGSLDAQTRTLMQELLLGVWERHHQTVLFITHDIEEALLLADTVCVMTARPGRIKKRITVPLARPRPIEVTTSPEFNALKRELLALIREESVRAAADTALGPAA
jgi:ABC-type nitrate/sulfonate/bicarbonate transport system ATPase subunit